MVSGTENDFSVQDWMEEGKAGMKAKRHKMMPRIMPTEFRRHMRAARKEMLLAVRSVVDEAITRLERKDVEDATPRTTSIKVD